MMPLLMKREASLFGPMLVGYGRLLLPMPAQDVFHPIFQLQFAFLQGDFFDLLRLGQVRLDGQLVQPFVQLVMLRGECAELFVGIEQGLPKFVRGGHALPP